MRSQFSFFPSPGVWTWLLAFVVFGLNASSWAQDESLSMAVDRIADEREVEQATANVTRKDPKNVSLVVSPSGMQRHVPGRWAMMSVGGANRTSTDTEEFVTVLIGDDPNLQFGRRVWIPAGSRRQAWLPALLPKFDPMAQRQIAMKSIWLKETESGERFQSNYVGSPISDRSLLISAEQSRTVALVDSANTEQGDAERTSRLLDALYVCRDSVGGAQDDLGIVRYRNQFLPNSSVALDPIDHLVVASDRLVTDSVAAMRIQEWVRDGGQLWLMLDQLDSKFPGQILGDLNCVTEIDRVELNDVSMNYLGQGGAVSFVDKWSSDAPVEMVRVICDATEVKAEIDGWPAVATMNVGQGRVLLTTVNLRALIANGQPSQGLHKVAMDFFVARNAPQRFANKLTRLTEKEIGYSIPSRVLVGAVLGAHFLVVLLVSAWLAHKKRLQHMAWLVPVAAAVAAIVLLVVGKQNTESVPSTIATGQFARVLPSGNEMELDSATAIFTSESETLSVSAPPNTVMQLEGAGPEELRRLVWTDDGRSEYQHMRQPPGVVRHVTSKATVDLAEPWSVVGQFTSRGFEGRLNGLDAAKCQDAVVVSDSTPSLAIHITTNSNDENVLLGEPTNVLPDSQFIDSALMTNQQRDRQIMMRNLIKPSAALFGRKPTMLVWTDPIDAGVRFDKQFQRRGSALVALPISFQQSAPGDEFVVPPNFVSMELNAGERGYSAIYNPQTGRWLDNLTKAGSVELDCVLPSALMPCELTAATIEIKLNAPSRTLELNGLVDGKFQTLHRKENPNGLITVQIDDHEWLRQITPQAVSLQSTSDTQAQNFGALRLQVSVSATLEEVQGDGAISTDNPALVEQMREQRSLASSSAGNARSWQIEFVRVSFRGIAK